MKINELFERMSCGEYATLEMFKGKFMIIKLKDITNNELNNRNSTHESNDKGSHNVEKAK